MSEQIRIAICILLPIFAAIIGFARPKLRAATLITTTLLVAGLVISLYDACFSKQMTYTLFQVAIGLKVVIQTDPLTWMFALISSLLWIPASIYALTYMQDDARAGRFFAFYILSLSATLGIAFAGNLITLYLFYELLTLVTFPLIMHNGDAAAQQAGRSYIMYGLFGAALILLAIALTTIFTPSFTFIAGGMLYVGTAQVQLARILLLLFVFGFGVKAAIVPMHSWLPLAMAAPTPVSALLHAVAVVNAGIYGILRVLYTLFGHSLLIQLGMRPVLITIACFTIILGSIWALRERHLKRRLAFSTVSQMGYLLLGGALLTPLGLQATLLHFLNHGLLKIVLFFSVGVLNRAGITTVDEVQGVGKRMPLVFTAMTLASLGMVGIVPLNGFVSKWYYLQGALQANSYLVVAVLALSSLLNALYFLPIITKAFFGQPTDLDISPQDQPRGLVLPGFIVASCALLLGIFPQWIIRIAEKAVHLIS